MTEQEPSEPKEPKRGITIHISLEGLEVDATKAHPDMLVHKWSWIEIDNYRLALMAKAKGVKPAPVNPALHNPFGGNHD